jgi:hypothetical protein
MNYGIESYAASAPVSLILSLLLFFGISIAGSFFLKFSKLDNLLNDVCDNFYLAPISGCLFLLILISPFTLIGYSDFKFLRVIAIIIIIFSFFSIYKIKEFRIYFSDKYYFYLLFFLFLYFLLALSPTTSADSLDYHTNVAIYILNNGTFPTEHFWFHSRQAGYGEILISLGLSIGAEQFGSLVQFSGLLIIFGILKKNINYENKFFFISLLMLLSSPILVFLISSNKPQMMGSGLIALCFVITFFRFGQRENNAIIYFSIINIILIFSVYIKYSFSVSAFIIWFFFVLEILKNKFNKLKFLFIQIVIFCVFALPYILWKIYFFNSNFLEASFLSLPINLYGYKALWVSVSSCGYDCSFPWWIFFPKNISQVTQTLGLSSVVILFVLLSKKITCNIKIAIIFYFFIFLSFGQHNARFFLDPFIWSIIAYSIKINEFKKFKIFSLSAIYSQSIITTLLVCYGILTLSYGSLSENWRRKVLEKSAYNYYHVEWINQHIPSNSILLTIDPKTAYLKTKNISLFFFNYIDLSNFKTYYYYNLIQKQNPTHISFMLPNDEKYYNLLKNCLGRLIKKQKKVGSLTGRNPFKINQSYYDSYLYEFDNSSFPNCIYNKIN